MFSAWQIVFRWYWQYSQPLLTTLAFVVVAAVVVVVAGIINVVSYFYASAIFAFYTYNVCLVSCSVLFLFFFCFV